MTQPTAKVSQQVNRKFRPRNTAVQLSVLTQTLSCLKPHPKNFKICMSVDFKSSQLARGRVVTPHNSL